MKIAVVTATYPPYTGGMGNVAKAHADACAGAGHAVTVLAPGSGLTPVFRWGNAAWTPQLLWKLRGFDVVELHYPFFGGAEWVWLWKILFGRSARLAVVYHMDTIGRGWLGAVFAAYRAMFLKAVLSAADRIIVTSRDYFAASQASAFADRPNVREVPIGVDTDRFSNIEYRLNAQSSIGRIDNQSIFENRKSTALFVGGLDRAHYFKGVSVLLEAFVGITTGLAIVGDGDLRPGFEERARALGIADRVRFLGKVPDAGLPAVYRSAAFLVLPSLDRSEAFGLVTLEAAASGRAAIVSDLPGVRTVVEDGVTGLRVPPGDVRALAAAVSRLADEPGLAARMGAAARKRVEERYADAIVARTLLGALLP